MRHLWERFCRYIVDLRELGYTLDISRVRFDDDDLTARTPALLRAMDAMEALEAGAIANPDENRMVGHYWLRAPELAPPSVSSRAIRATIKSIKEFAAEVHSGQLCGTNAPFEHVVHIGIGGSALGPQLVCAALTKATSPMHVHVLDNADPESIHCLLQRLDHALDRTLVSVVSKSGWTPTPHQVMVELRRAYSRRGIDFARHAVATTMVDGELDKLAMREDWLARFPLWDWVGGRTSVTSAVGLLPIALIGADIDSFLGGAAAMDRHTRDRNPRTNSAALLAFCWYTLGRGYGDKAMVILPYKDRLSLLPRYLQQLVMESLGKKFDRRGNLVRQGLTVYGNKGSTDQHAYVQQLRDGRDDAFVTFIRVHDDGWETSPDMGAEPTLGDHLFSNLEGTRDALEENDRDSITITVRKLDAASLGALIALFERTVGFYAELIDVNAYHQPGVAKAAGAATLELQRVVVEYLHTRREACSAEEIAEAVGRANKVETVFRLLEHLSFDPHRLITMVPGSTPELARFSAILSHKGG
jgi:glucose-6-phosphate isomerase